MVVPRREQAALRADHARHHDRRVFGDLGHDRDRRAAILDRERHQLSRFEIFQFAKYPANVSASGDAQEKYRNRHNITYQQALHYYRLMEGEAREVCLKSFGYEVKGQAVYNGVKTTPSLLIVGTNKSFLTANAYTLGYGRNLNDEDVDLSRRVIVVGKMIEKRLFPHETPIGKVVRVSGHTYTIIGVLAEKGTAFGQSQDDICIMPITRFFEDYGEAKRTVNIATQAFTPGHLQSHLRSSAIGAMRIARGLRPDQPNDFEIYSNDSLKSAFTNVAGYVRVGAFVISFIALVAAGIGIMNIMLVSVTERTKEIGVRKSIGARSRDILRQFLTEAVFISEAGGILGIILGVIGGDLLAMWLKVDLIFPYGWAIAGLACLLSDRDRLWSLPGLSRGRARSDRSVTIRITVTPGRGL